MRIWIWIVLAVVVVLVAVLVPVIIVVVRKKKGGGGALPGRPMPIPVMKKGGPWRILNVVNPERISSNGSTVKITYVTKEQGMSSGAAFKAAPPGLPATKATLSYEVYFPRDFQWVKGGKLPGLCIGSTPTDCATGGEWSKTGGSCRIMFRAGGQGIGYFYLPYANGTAAYNAQPAAYKAVVEASQGATGHTAYLKKQKAFQFKLGQWNSVSMSVDLGKPGGQGSVQLSVNGSKRSIPVNWLPAGCSSKVQSVEFVSFYGGGDLSWMCTHCTYTEYRNLKFSASS